MKNWGGKYLFVDGKGNTRDNVQLMTSMYSFDERSFQEYLWWLDVAKNKSIGNKTMWVARTLSEGEIESSGTKRCLADSRNLTGIVTTNANMYISAPPTFNEVTKTLDYKVASPHEDPTGKLNVGSYNLVLSSEAARCLYNFTKAPVSATVSIISADGNSQVATTSVSEKNGWLYLSANGFNFSAPLVRVKLTQEADNVVGTPTSTASPSPISTPTPVASPVASPLATPSASPTPTMTPKPRASTQAAAGKKVTITCVKGKTVKKVTAIKPVCPSGYKKR
jgi:hypothetical protein